MTDTDRPDDEGPGYGLVCPFWIDTDAYSDRDRSMFACGVEFAAILDHARDAPGPLSAVIHRENESRVRMLCGRFRRTCRIEPCGAQDDPAGTWSFLEIGPARPEEAQP